MERITGYVYSNDIEILQGHPKMFENEQGWGLQWDRERPMESFPPCIAISVNADHAEDFKLLAREVCPDCYFADFETFVV